MKLGLRNNRDFWAGLMLIGMGAAGMVMAHGYRFGSALRMGPGFFPMILGGILIGFGICVMVVAFGSKAKIEGHLSIRALLMLPLSLVLFGFLVQYVGYIPALVALVFFSAASGREFKLREVLLLTVILTVASVALFIWALGLPYPLIKGF